MKQFGFLRAINVGGRTKLPMKDLVNTLERVGIHGAVTYIQSGNIAFRCSKVQASELSRRMSSAIQGDYGHVASKNGTGAVLGKKKLKAVAIERGSRGAARR